MVLPPSHNPDARFFCAPCCLVFTGSSAEREAEQRRKVKRQRDESEWRRVASAGMEALHNVNNRHGENNEEF